MKKINKYFINLLIVSLLITSTYVEVFAVAIQNQLITEESESDAIEEEMNEGFELSVLPEKVSEEFVNSNEDTELDEETVDSMIEEEVSMQVSEELESSVVSNSVATLAVDKHVKRISKFVVENNKLVYDGYSYVAGVNIPKKGDIIQKLKFVNASTGKQVKTFELDNFYSTAVTKDPNHGAGKVNYDWAKFKGAVDISSLPAGDYKIKIYTNAKGQAYDEVINFHSSISDFKFSSKGKIFSFVRENSTLNLSVTEDPAYNPADQHVKRVSYFYEQEGYIYMNGYSYVKDIDIPKKNDIIQKLKFVNTTTGKQVKTYSLNNYYSNALSKDSNHGGGKVNYDYGKFESYIDIDDLPTGEYYIKVYTSAKGEAYDEIINFHSTIPAFEFETLTKRFTFIRENVKGTSTMKLIVEDNGSKLNVISSPKQLKLSFFEDFNSVIEIKSGEKLVINFNDINHKDISCSTSSPILDIDLEVSMPTFKATGYGDTEIKCSYYGGQYTSVTSYKVYVKPSEAQLKKVFLGSDILKYMGGRHYFRVNNNSYAHWANDSKVFGEIEAFSGGNSEMDMALYFPLSFGEFFDQKTVSLNSQYKQMFEFLFPTKTAEFINFIKSSYGKTTKTTIEGRVVQVFTRNYPQVDVMIGPATTRTSKLTNIYVDRNDITLAKGLTHEVNTLLAPGNTINRALVWSSNNPSVATVNSQGKITAVSNGNATITVTSATDSSIKVAIKVKVVSHPCEDETNYCDKLYRQRYDADQISKFLKEQFKFNQDGDLLYITRKNSSIRPIQFENLRGESGWNYRLTFTYDSREDCLYYYNAIDTILFNLWANIVRPALNKELPNESVHYLSSTDIDYDELHHYKVKVNYNKNNFEILVGPGE